MDDGRLDSPPAIQVEGYHQPYGAHFSSSRRSSLSSSTSRSYSQSAMPMSIPRAKVDSVPPPLPPPRYVEDLAMGQDLGWQMGNTSRKQFGKTDGDPSPWGWNRPSPDERYSEPFGTPRRLSSISTNLHDHDRFEYPVKDEGYHSLSGTSITSKSVSPSHCRPFPSARRAIPSPNGQLSDRGDLSSKSCRCWRSHLSPPKPPPEKSFGPWW